MGNADLAKLRKPILKHLYKEDPAVTATPREEVAAARKKLDTVVDGCDIKPVTAFNQCGKRTSHCYFSLLHGWD